ncbi:hypothetical protein ACMFMG_003785 [Clarireedia jacksonii]
MFTTVRTTFLPFLLIFTSLATATNTLTFHNLFPTPRLLQFIPVSSSYAIPQRLIPAHSTLSISTPLWNGFFKAVSPDTPEHGPENSIVGEVCFECWQGITFFDVSAIWNCCDNSGVHWMGSVDAGARGKGVEEVLSQASERGEVSTRLDEIVVVLGP